MNELPARAAWSGWEPIGDAEGTMHNYLRAGGFGVIGREGDGWSVVFGSDGYPVDEHRHATPDAAMDAAERIAATEDGER